VAMLLTTWQKKISFHENTSEINSNPLMVAACTTTI